MKDLIGLLFRSRDITHLLHLKTESYAQHVALQDYYDALLPMIDELVEALQGYNEELYKDLEIPASNANVEIINHLADLNDEINKVEINNIGIQNVLDDISTLINTTIYKLKFLK